MNKNYKFFLAFVLTRVLKLYLLGFILCFASAAVLAQPTKTLTPLADAYVRNGTYASANFGSDTSLVVKSSTSSGYTRFSYLKFSLSNITNVNSAKLRVYGLNKDNTSTVNLSSYGIDTDSWTESGITFNNAPAPSTSALATAIISNQAQYYEFDVTGYVQTQLAGDKVVSLLIKDPGTQNINVAFNSKEDNFNRPQLVIDTTVSTGTISNAKIFIENLDKFPPNTHFVFSRIQTPWSRDTVHYNSNHDSLTVRIHNNGINNLIVKNLILSNDTSWQFVKLNGNNYVPGTSLPLSITSGAYADLTVKFVAVNAGTRVSILHDTLTIISNDDKFPSKPVFLDGIWQKQGEGSHEPSSQQVIAALGFKTRTGFGQEDPDKGDSTKLKGDEIKPAYFVRADTSFPVSITEIAAYHACCTFPEKLLWFAKGSGSTNIIFTHMGQDGQSLLPRKSTPNTIASGTINPTTAFGFKVTSNSTDPSLNYAGKLGIRVYKAYDANGNIIPNSYILANDYLGTSSTNYDYNDNMYFVTNVRPQTGSAFYSALSASPSAVDFGEKILQTANSLQLNLSSLGKTYSNGSADPALTISSVVITGENNTEFTASMPVKTSLNPQENTTLTVNFNPASQGLKIADLLIYYNNSQSPLRVPLYGIGKASGTTVTANYRVNSGSTTSLTLNNKTWSADTLYSFDNLEPFKNSSLKQIACTNEDSLYLKEQSSNGDKKPFRYEFPVSNGDYVVRLHFAELYWGAPGSGLAGGAGSRVMNISIENQLRLANFDVTQEVGGATAIVKNFPVTVTDGKLNINFSANVNRPMVVAVEVYSFRTASARPLESSNESIVDFDNNLKKVRVYPNPVQKRLMVQFPSKYSGNSNLQIVDASGRIYEIGKYMIQSGGSTQEVDISNLSLKPGFYYLRIFSEIRPTEVIKLIVP